MAAATGQGFASNSNDPVILKVVVDLAYFNSLLDAEAFRQKYFEKQKHKLEISSYPEKQKPILEISSYPEKSLNHNAAAPDGDPEQTGEGAQKKNLFQIEEHKLRKIIREELEHYFDKPPQSFLDLLKQTTLTDVVDILRKIPYLSRIIGRARGEQVGQGWVDTDLTPITVTEHHTADAQALTEGGEYTEMRKVEPTVDKQQFLKSVPNNFKAKANKLLDWIEENPLIIRWDNEGLVTIENDTISDSNIFTIWKELYERHPNTSVPGYVSVASLFMNSGMGSLFRNTEFHFNTRKRKLNSHIQSGAGALLTNNDWYFLN
jgi:hypothetical protein